MTYTLADAHADGRHDNPGPGDRRFWAAAGCAGCAEILPPSREEVLASMAEGLRALALPESYCKAEARLGRGTGICDAPLDAHGNCPRADRHIES